MSGADQQKSSMKPDLACLIIDSNDARRASLGRWVGRAGFVPRAAETAEKARRELESGRFDLVIAAPGVLDAEGLARFEALSEQMAPVTAECLDDSCASASSTSRHRRAKRPVPCFSAFGRLIGASNEMQRVYTELLRVAPTEATVTLIGESGTGKELAAELIHGLSSRSTKPFVPINCGALSPTLIESEIFGHERGSFTGADRRRAGLFERAQGGTLFLDEITEMPLDLQVKLLRVLESRQIRRVGGGASIDVDVRVIAATNRDPERAVASGRLREDLLYRLLVFPVDLPPLRDRSEDVMSIAQAHLRRLNAVGATQKQFTADAADQLQGHHWPGNVRELRNVVERAFILADETISGDCFAFAELARSPGHTDSEDQAGVRVGMSLAEMNRRMTLATLEELRGDKKKAATTLGISLKTLYTRLNVYNATRAA